MPRLRANVAAAMLAIAVTGCSPLARFEGETVYTQRNLWVTDGVHETTNYRLGYRIPVNTEVRIGDTDERAIKVRVPETGERFIVINVRDHSRRDISAIYQRYFAPTPQDLARFTPGERDAIRDGEIEPGMSRDAVLLARGYPPAHETESIRMREWVYWKGGHDTVVVRFDDGRVTAVED